MHPSQIMSVKSRVIQANAAELAPLARRILRLDETGKIKDAVEKLNLMTGIK
jgi:phosphotransferase system enzyme I (PtsI)